MGAIAKWSRVFVQIDETLSPPEGLRVGECKQIPVRDFAIESWKRMPPRDLHVARVAVVATIVQGHYAKKSFLDQSAPPPRLVASTPESVSSSPLLAIRSNSRA